MSPVKDAVREDIIEGTAVEPEVTSNEQSGFEDGLAWRVHEFRGTRYKVVELPIGEFDEITKKSNRKEKVVDPDTGESRDVEVFDRTLQARLMLKACVVEPARVDISKLGTRLTVALNTIINEMHFGDEPDELAERTAKAKADAAEDAKPGNG